MTQPPTYNRSFSFTNYQTYNPTTPLPGTNVDIELNNVKATLDAINANLALLQNNDGTVLNASIGVNQLASAIVAGFNPPKTWATVTAYTASPASTVFNSSKIYTCLISHTAGTFATDLAAGKWQLILDLTTIPITAASQVSVTASGLLTTDVQGSLQALDSGKAATSHTHASSAISDSTADGRAFLTATLASQKTLLGLGSLAFLNSVAVTAISANLAYTGVITPAALAGNTNDWAPTGLATAARIRASTTAAWNLTGLSGGSDGRVVYLDNVGSSTLTLTANDASSSAANRFQLYSNLVLQPNTSVSLMYDGTVNLWRRLDPPSEIDGINPSQGQIVYRGASAWAALAAGTAGQVLQTAGANANPAWASVAPFALGRCTLALAAVANTVSSTSSSVVTHSGAHGLSSGQIIWSNSGTLPTGWTVNAAYYVGVVNTTTYKIYTTLAGALAVDNSQVSLTNGSGFTGALRAATVTVSANIGLAANPFQFTCAQTQIAGTITAASAFSSTNWLPIVTWNTNGAASSGAAESANAQFTAQSTTVLTFQMAQALNPPTLLAWPIGNNTMETFYIGFQGYNG